MLQIARLVMCRVHFYNNVSSKCLVLQSSLCVVLLFLRLIKLPLAGFKFSRPISSMLWVLCTYFLEFWRIIHLMSTRGPECSQSLSAEVKCCNQPFSSHVCVISQAAEMQCIRASVEDHSCQILCSVTSELHTTSTVFINANGFL